MDAGDFEEFFRATYPMLTRYARRVVDPSTAEELAASTLQKVWEQNVPAPASDVERRKLRSLAYRILEGKIRNEWRAAGRRRRNELAAVDLGIAWAESENWPPEGTCEGWPAWAAALSATDREVLALAVDGFKTGEIADILGCTPAAVTMRLQRAKRRARGLWSEEVQSDQRT